MKKLLTIKNAFTCLATVCLATGASAQFSPGNVVVLQAGDGSTALANTGNAVVLREFTPAGVPAYSMAIPTSSATGLTILGNSTAEGFLSLSSNGQQLVIPGYAGTYTSSIASSTGTQVPRVIGTVDAAGTYTRVASSTSFHTGGNIRSAVSDGTGNYWSLGSNQGVNYFGNSAAPANIEGFVTNNRALSIQAGDLAFSSAAGTARGIYVVNTIGSGTTTVPASTVTLVVPTGTASAPCQFAIAPTLTYGYVADESAISAGGGIQKWTFNGFTWTLAYTFATSTNTSVTVGARGLVVDFSGTNPVIYATSAETSSNRLISIVDGGSLATSTITTLATATTSNTIFRGLAFTPTATATCTTPTINVNSASICSGGSATLTASGATNYTWSPATNLNTTSGATVVANPTTTTTYTVMGATGTCTAMATTTVNVISTPTMAVTSASVCSGQTVSIVASGVSTYTWTTPTSNSPTITVSPSATTVYTVSGNAAGCAGTFSATGTVSVATTPTLSATSGSVCTGKTIVLTATGTAATYSWNPSGVTTNTILVSAANAGLFTFTVTGTSAQGCSNSTTANLVGIATPTINVTATPSVICAGSSTTLTATGATSYTWSNGVANGTGFTPTTTATYTVTGTSAIGGCTNTAVSTVSVNPCTGIHENANNTVFSVYPNPSNGNFTVQSSVFPATLVMYDVTGKQVIRKDITELETNVNVSQLNNGIYYISLIAESGSMNYKMVISK